MAKGWIAIDQIRTIDRMRIVKHFEALTEEEITQVKNVIKKTLRRKEVGSLRKVCGYVKEKERIGVRDPPFPELAKVLQYFKEWQENLLLGF